MSSISAGVAEWQMHMLAKYADGETHLAGSSPVSSVCAEVAESGYCARLESEWWVDPHHVGSNPTLSVQVQGWGNGSLLALQAGEDGSIPSLCTIGVEWGSRSSLWVSGHHQPKFGLDGRQPMTEVQVLPPLPCVVGRRVMQGVADPLMLVRVQHHAPVDQVGVSGSISVRGTGGEGSSPSLGPTVIKVN